MDMLKLLGNTQVPPLFGKFDAVSCHRLWTAASLCITFSPLVQGLRNQSEAALGVFHGLWSLLRHDSCLSCQCIGSVMPHETFPGEGIGSCVKENNYHVKRCCPTLQDLPHQRESLACSFPLCLVWISLHTQTHLPSKDANLASANHPGASLIVLSQKPWRVRSLRDLMKSIHVRQCCSVLLSENRVKIKWRIKEKDNCCSCYKAVLKNINQNFFFVET